MRKLLAAGIVAAALVTGCSGGGRQTGPADTPADSTVATKPGDVAPVDAEAPSTTAEPQPAELALKVTFDRGDRTRATLALDGTGRAAYIDNNTTFLVLADRTVTCTGSGRAQVCTEVPGTPAGTTATKGAFAPYPRLIELVRTLPGTTTAREQLVGRSASCTTFDLAGLGLLGGALLGTGGPSTGTGRICTDEKTGALLQFTSDATARAAVDIVAVQVGKPTPRDFDPPKPPTSAPAAPTLPTLPGLGSTASP